ncbi:MAG TPA: FCD domain-containing protein, partial [Azospirillaceae bacterium]|nr:FCD domain-containing protein [Azospirillaceae bacterium]
MTEIASDSFAPGDEAHSTPLAYLLQAHSVATYDYLEFRCVVEGEAARLAAERADEADRAMLTRRFDAIEAMHAKDDPTEEADADAEFHLGVYEAAHNLVLLHIMRGFSSMLRNDVFYSRNRLYSRKGVRDLLLQQHRAIYEAILARDPAAAADAAT